MSSSEMVCLPYDNMVSRILSPPLMARVVSVERDVICTEVVCRTEARRRKSIDPAAGNPLDDFDEWLHDIEAPPSWINTVVFCVAHLAEELTGFRPGDYGIVHHLLNTDLIKLQ